MPEGPKCFHACRRNEGTGGLCHRCSSPTNGGGYPARMSIRSAGSDAELAVTAAQAGAAVVRGMYGAPLMRFEKSAGDFATAADLEAEKVILDVIRTARPDDAVTGEESGRAGADGAERMWLVDPLCGTLNYAVRNMLVAVNVALRVGSDITAAASADPFTAEVFWTDGERAYVRSDGVDEELMPSPDSRLVDVNLDPPFPSEPGFRAVRLLAETEFVQRFRPRVVSTTLAVAWVAAGRRAAYVTDGHLRDSVHFASGIALCQAAGCLVTGLDGRPLHTGGGGLVVAADEETHTALLQMISRQVTLVEAHGKLDG
ncbi:inositol monophosphatase family protein [Nonomuraea africana]|uniref:inositol monophosphatase family protein n=1 Tax=Nonomuraea africana TaxID=46171 RepID=UPI0034031FB7